MINDNGFELELMSCEICGDEFYAAPDDPTDKCACSCESRVAADIEMFESVVAMLCL